MNEVGAADRSRLLRSKRTELSGIVTSRKRKLREFFAVCDNERPLPQLNLSNPDAPLTSVAEEHFLDVSDILKNRPFDESNLPTRRQLRSDTTKPKPASRKPSPDSRTPDSPRKGKAQRDGSKPRKSRAPTPNGRIEGSRSIPVVEIITDGKPKHDIPMERSTSKGSQTDLPAESNAVLEEIVEETFENANQRKPSMPNTTVPAKNLETDRIRTVLESRPNSPGVDPRKAMPISPEDAAQLSEPLIDGLGSHDAQHKAATVHLPPKEVQEAHLREVDKARAEKAKEEERTRLAISLPPRDGTRHTDPVSSPGSTVGAQSATTPALHDASTDTSPDNESSRFDVERTEKEEEPQTPPELKRTPEEIAEKEEHDKILKAQMEISRAEILGSSPNAADNQLRMEEQAASLTTDATQPAGPTESISGEEGASPPSLTKEASEVVEDVVENTNEVATSTVPEDTEMSGLEPANEPAKEPAQKKAEIADSEEEVETPVDQMDIDTTTIKDSFESRDGLNTSSPVAPRPAEPASEPPANSKGSSITPTSETPRKTPSTPAATAPLPERMITRVSSGAIRHKSVSEILGERGFSNGNVSEHSPGNGAAEPGSAVNSATPSRSATPQSPGSRRSLIEEAKKRERSKLSTVTFSRRTNKPSSSDTALMPAGSHANQNVHEDYFKPLFSIPSATDKRSIPQLDNLLATARKTITTSNAYVPIHENQTVKILKRIYNLQSSHKWSLRQPKRAVEPNRPTTHWDVLLQEAKWMRTDFREERKWKMAVARNMAFACAEWMTASPEDRKLLQVNAVPPKPSNDVEMDPPGQDVAHSTPELVASGADSPTEIDEEPHLDLLETVAPAAIFGLPDDEVVFGLRRSPTADKLLDELPMYGAPLVVPQSDLPTSEVDPDRFWRRPALPLSKYVEGRMELKCEGPPRKRSRYQYEDDDDDDDQVVFGEPGLRKPILPPEHTDVALFNPEHKHIRDRIHSSHQFRPPSEFPMPLQSFFENRVASQWMWDEDNELKTLVREYSYNWSLISSMLTSKSMFSSGAERRTPWECFERWIHLEGLPADMQKTHYFRAYTTRIETANRNVMAQAAAAVPPQPGPNGQIQPPPRRRTTSSVRVERRRNQKHLTLVDAMRKLAKKRETSIQKQQQAAGMAALRKANDNHQNPAHRIPLQTPQQISQLRHERDEQLKERMLILQQRQEAQRRAVLLQQRNAQQNPQQLGLPNTGNQPRPPLANGALALTGTPGTASQNLAVPGQNRPRPMPPQMGQQMPNGLRVPQMPMNGVPAAPMQGMQGQLPMPNPAVSVGLINQAARTAEEQRAMIQMQQQGKIPSQSPQMHNSPPRMNGMPAPGFPMQNMMAFNANASMPTPPVNGMMSSPNQGHGQAGSPRMGQHAQPQDGAPPQMNHIQRMEAHFKKQYPNASPEHITKMIRDTLQANVQRAGLAQSAMNAAAGAGSGMSGMNGTGQRMPAGVENSPQMYAQMLRQQQESQQKELQARQAASALAVAQSQGSGATNSAQGHAHRNSSGSVGSTK
ncbi:hypothetical protein BGZ60DRAFT_421049 [Tricladium varicosporioides]|nr:hypothetical protein BGZ60DRAFT_421049 [Hymenoscyphus varicosporioides]